MRVNRLKSTAVAAITAVALTVGLAAAAAPAASAQSASAGSSAPEFQGSAYHQWLQDNVARTGNPQGDVALMLLADFAIGSAVLGVLGPLYAEIARRLGLVH
ncbi:hypothetical protein G7Y31_05285 [Corynebacterium lizhenjunii]|uniref:Uncharacterized protein n=1 Tax=Corynebacterium lizhenjunii TaxID=2709394 RepID=A0A7T0KGD8_9CORY|nr:hypothetical protein [Corynebacterium lizhenjunii]QPK80099.1 hypothetical protein G7Y31_05285 [Corynebacterium lizhenjunii]